MKDLLDGIRILLVEDEADARWMLSKLFSFQKAQVRAAESAHAALSCLDQGFVPDILISDVNLPDEDGYWVVREVKKRFPKLPAIALTALTRPADRKAALEAGFAEHVSKPFQFERLFGAIRNLTNAACSC